MKRSLTLTALSFLVLAQLSLAQVPQTISYQGVLRDAGNLANDAYTLRFKLFDVATGGIALGTPEWSEDHTTTVTDGVFSVVLGSISVFSDAAIRFTQPYWLEIAIVDGATVTTLSSRIELTSVPYAMKSGGVRGDNITFHTGSGGTLGIGTTSPKAGLHVAQGNWILGSSSGYSNLAESALLTTFSGILYESGGLDWAHHFSAYEGGDIARFGISTGAGLEPDTRVVINNAGYVGIGTATPTTALDVVGTVTANSFAGDGSALTGLTPSPWMTSGTNIYYTTGSVGIGTASPFDMLDVTGNIRINDGDIFFRGGTDIAHGLGWYGDGTRPFGGVGVGGPVLYGSTGGGLGTSSGTQNVALYWNQAGSVGIGTTSPAQKLEVNGTVLSSGFALNNTNTKISSLTTNNIDFVTNNAARVRIDPSGNVGIGTTAPTAKLEVAGDAKINGNLTVTGTTTIPTATRYYSLPHAAFEAHDDNVNYWRTNTYLYLNSGYGYFYAPLNLPDGAVIKELLVTYWDNIDTTDVLVTLRRLTLSDGGEYNGGGPTSSGQSSAVRTMSNAYNLTVDNQNYTYLLFAQLPSPSTNMRLYGARIKYEITSPLP